MPDSPPTFPDIYGISFEILESNFSVSQVALHGRAAELFQNGIPDENYKRKWHKKAGIVSFLQESSSAAVQSPLDGLDFYSFACERQIRDINCPNFRGNLYCSSSNTLEACRLAFESFSQRWTNTNLPIVSIPLQLLRLQIEQSSENLTDLMKRVEHVEMMVASGSTATPFDDLVRTLHYCNTNLIKLERRWHFQEKLAATINVIVGRHSSHPKICPAALQELQDDCVLQDSLSHAMEYDLSVLPRRISNQFTAIYNLIAQRDTKATIELASDSHAISQAALRESSSMKTIAAMTLIFLPATFLCSFFSMTFFDWQAGPGESATASLWIYFAVCIPLTAFVILTWIVCTRWSRKKKEGRDLKKRHALLPRFEKEGPKVG